MPECLYIEQGTPEWFEARLGVVTASRFADVMAKGRSGAESKTRRTYMLTLLGERLTGEVQESYSNNHMERGQEMEADARAAYEFQSGNDVRQVGFVRKDDNIGASPDGLIDEDGLLEIKTKLPHRHLDCLLSEKVPTEHTAQIQGQLWVCEREWLDFVSYWPGLPLFVKRVNRDDPYIKTMSEAVDKFVSDMADLEAKLRSWT